MVTILVEVIMTNFTGGVTVQTQLMEKLWMVQEPILKQILKFVMSLAILYLLVTRMILIFKLGMLQDSKYAEDGMVLKATGLVSTKDIVIAKPSC